jgi:hypothetical protein
MMRRSRRNGIATLVKPVPALPQLCFSLLPACWMLLSLRWGLRGYAKGRLMFVDAADRGFRS